MSGNGDFSEVGTLALKHFDLLLWVNDELRKIVEDQRPNEVTRAKLLELLLLQRELDSMVRSVLSVEDKLSPRGHQEMEMYHLAYEQAKQKLKSEEHSVQEQGTVDWASLEMVRQFLALLHPNDPRLVHAQTLLRHFSVPTPTRMFILVFREFAALVTSANQQRSQQPMQGAVPSRYPTTSLDSDLRGASVSPLFWDAKSRCIKGCNKRLGDNATSEVQTDKVARTDSA